MQSRISLPQWLKVGLFLAGDDEEEAAELEELPAELQLNELAFDMTDVFEPFAKAEAWTLPSSDDACTNAPCSAAVYLSALAEIVCEVVVNVARNIAHLQSKKTVGGAHVHAAVQNSSELAGLYGLGSPMMHLQQLQIKDKYGPAHFTITYPLLSLTL